MLRRWNLRDGSSEVLLEEVERFDLSDNGQSLLVLREGQVELHDLAQGRSRVLLPADAEGAVTKVALDPTGKIAAVGTEGGLVLVLPVSGGPPHLLMGHRKAVGVLTFSADGTRLATGSEGGVIRIWPMPDLSRPPLQTLPFDELLPILRSLTNLRVVEDSDAWAGWSLAIGPFPGWEEVPTW